MRVLLGACFVYLLSAHAFAGSELWAVHRAFGVWFKQRRRLRARRQAKERRAWEVAQERAKWQAAVDKAERERVRAEAAAEAATKEQRQVLSTRDDLNERVRDSDFRRRVAEKEKEEVSLRLRVCEKVIDELEARLKRSEGTGMELQAQLRSEEKEHGAALHENSGLRKDLEHERTLRKSERDDAKKTIKDLEARLAHSQGQYKELWRATHESRCMRHARARARAHAPRASPPLIHMCTLLAARASLSQVRGRAAGRCAVWVDGAGE